VGQLLSRGCRAGHRQDGLNRVFDAANKANVDRRAPTEVLAPDINLDDLCFGRINLPAGEVGAQQEQDIAAFDRPVAGCESQQAGQPNIIGILILDEWLTP
jgi:hypothetical protein